MIKGKVVFDARMINNSGIGRYIEKILINTIDRFESITLLGNEKDIQEKLNKKDLKIIEFTSPFYSIGEQIKYPIIIPKCDLFWSPHFNIPLLPIKAKKRLTTVHDVFHLAFYDMLTISQKIYAKIVLKAAMEKSDQIITVSNFSKQEIIKHLGSKYNAKIHSIHNGIDNLSENKQYHKHDITTPYFLAVGNIKPHKNFKRTIEAYKIFLEKNINNINVPKFFIIGKKDGLITGDNSAFNIVNEHEILKEHVHFIGFVSDKELKEYYKNALALIFPSYYEGFGFPPLEAMQLGTPVIVSNAACIPEICGNAACYFDPYDINDIALNMDKVFLSDNFHKELSKKGLERVLEFSWEKSANESIKIIENLIS